MKPPAYRPDSFESEHGFWLYPERDVFHRVQRLRDNEHRSVREVADKVDMIVGEIEASEIDGDSLERGSSLRVEFVDNADGVSELVFDTVTHRKTRFGQKKYYTKPMLHPSESLQNDSNYEWDVPQEIVRIDFI